MERTGGLVAHLGQGPLRSLAACKRGRQAHLEAGTGLREAF